MGQCSVAAGAALVAPSTLVGALTNPPVLCLPFPPPRCQGFRETCRVTAKCSSQPEVTHRLLVEIVPSSDPDLRELIVRHNLFAKELLLYSRVLPELREYVRRRARVSRTVDVTFSVPK